MTDAEEQRRQAILAGHVIPSPEEVVQLECELDETRKRLWELELVVVQQKAEIERRGVIINHIDTWYELEDIDSYLQLVGWKGGDRA